MLDKRIQSQDRTIRDLECRLDLVTKTLKKACEDGKLKCTAEWRFMD